MYYNSTPVGKNHLNKILNSKPYYFSQVGLFEV